MRLLVGLIYLLTITGPTVQASEMSQSALSLKTRLQVFASLPNWNTVLDDVLPMVASAEDVRFAKETMKKGGLPLSEWMAPVIKGDTIEFPALELSIRFLDNGKSIQVGPNIFRRNAGENLQHFAERINKTMQKKSVRSTWFLPQAEAKITLWDIAIGAGIIVGIIAGIAQAPVAIVLTALFVSVGAVGGKHMQYKELVDYDCDEDKPGFAFVLRDGTKVDATVIDRYIYTDEKKAKPKYNVGAQRESIKRAIHYVAAECPSSAAIHAEFKEDIEGFQKRVNPVEADASAVKD